MGIISPISYIVSATEAAKNCIGFVSVTEGEKKLSVYFVTGTEGAAAMGAEAKAAIKAAATGEAAAGVAATTGAAIKGETEHED